MVQVIDDFVTEAITQATQEGLQSINRYVLEEKLGRGVSGEAWKARDISTCSEVCVKYFHQEAEQAESEGDHCVKEAQFS